jgi:hypothetical protein
MEVGTVAAEVWVDVCPEVCLVCSEVWVDSTVSPEVCSVWTEVWTESGAAAKMRAARPGAKIGGDVQAGRGWVWVRVQRQGPGLVKVHTSAPRSTMQGRINLEH